MSWSRRPPEMTRVVVAGPGEGTARIYRSRVNAALETTWGDVIEGSIDARDIQIDDPNRDSLMDARGDAPLADAGLKYWLSLQLIESANFRSCGPCVHVGEPRQTAPQTGARPIPDAPPEAHPSWTRYRT